MRTGRPVALRRAARGGPRAIAAFALLLALRANLPLDAGVNLGVTGSAEDHAPFLGFGTRF